MTTGNSGFDWALDKATATDNGKFFSGKLPQKMADEMKGFAIVQANAQNYAVGFGSIAFVAGGYEITAKIGGTSLIEFWEVK